jgi:hypothetical protein
MTPFLTSQYRARVLVAFGSLLSAQAGAAQTSGSNPSAVNKPTLTYVPEQRAAVLFGGHTRSGTPLGETWLLKAGCWRQLDVSGPAPRGGHGAAYDTQRRRLVVFGGSGADRKPLGDTWEFDGAKWEQRSASGPPARMLLRMTFDTQRRRVLLFGGTDNMTGPHLGDTWQWDGTSWSPITDSGPPRDSKRHSPTTRPTISWSFSGETGRSTGSSPRAPLVTRGCYAGALGRRYPAPVHRSATITAWPSTPGAASRCCSEAHPPGNARRYVDLRRPAMGGATGAGWTVRPRGSAGNDVR